MKRAFVIRGFGTKKDSKGNEVDFERVHADLIGPALKQCGLAGSTTTEVEDAGNIRADMFALILEADLVICDITVHNANVFYELGVRHALRKKHTVLLKGDPSADATPFDLSTDRYLSYPVAQPGDGLKALVAAIEATRLSIRKTDSPIFLMLPKLTEADPSEVSVLPLELIDEVQRAEKAQDKGWLRVIAEDLAGQRYQRDGLRCVGRAQWSLKDVEGARTSWEAVLATAEEDIEANLALANLYERQFRDSGRETLLEMSNQAIHWVLDNQRCTSAQRAEALALQGRNLKTMWRVRLTVAAETTTDANARLQLALDRNALRSYRSYRSALACDLNAYYPGVAALQMGYILRRMAALPSWRNLFRGNQREADRAREDLDSELAELGYIVAAAVRRAQALGSEQDQPWADIAEADRLFLSLPEDEVRADPSLLVQIYRDAIPANKRFAWDATSGQLALFEQLGLRAEAARAVIDAFGAGPSQTASLRDHLVVFTGHAIDARGAAPRFPAGEAVEHKARDLIRAELQKLRDALQPNEQLVMLASAAPGADILAHEVCAELGIASRLCLPAPVDEVARHAFDAADAWRTRFHAVVERHATGLLQLSDHAELPRWLQGRTGVNLWERGNRWVLKTAQTWGARRVTLLALWDGVETGHQGGTAQMVRLARDVGHFKLARIDSRLLLA